VPRAQAHRTAQVLADPADHDVAVQERPELADLALRQGGVGRRGGASHGRGDQPALVSTHTDLLPEEPSAVAAVAVSDDLGGIHRLGPGYARPA